MRGFKRVVGVIGFLMLPALALAQVDITGTVIDSETKSPLPGASVVVQGTNLGAATNRRGEYRISNVPAGNYTVKATFIGYMAQTTQVLVSNIDVTVNFSLQQTALVGSEVVVEVNRAVERETPIAFTNVSGEEIAEKYTTQDVPGLLTGIPGVFTSSTGLGEADVYVRGFDTERVQIMINGIPVNDPESQKVYWSNWTGLSSTAKSIQVQRGVGSSLYGSGAFGGSLNINTMGLAPNRSITIRSSVGAYSVDGAPEFDNRVADGQGTFEGYSPFQYMTQVRYNSGLLNNGKFNFAVTAERKAGKSYIDGTTYDGWSFGLEAQSILGDHMLLFSFIGAPQHHNQASSVQDMELLDKLGREYNRRNHPFQENYYFKPQASLRHEWTISEKSFLSTNVFYTHGGGGGRYLRNDDFDASTGKIGFKRISESTDNKYFGRNARYIYEITNGRVVLTGYDPEAKTFNGTSVSRSTPIIASSFAHSWKNDSQNYHNQFGINTAFQNKVSDQVSFVAGGEWRYWVADHFAQSFLFRSYDANTGTVRVYDEVQRRYDYTSTVSNVSGFARLQFRPVENLNVMADGQIARYSSSVDENPIQIFDFEAGEWTGETFRTTADLRDSNGRPKFSNSDYERTFDFFSPKFGVNYNVSDNLNVLANYSIAHKEPKVGDWYSRSRGPGANQSGNELDAEKLNNIEFGVGYRSTNASFNANYYIMDFEDKIESITDLQGERVTINAGKSRHQGLEFAGRVNMDRLDVNASLTLAKNRWREMNLEKIFGVDASEVVDKVVPFSPEKMFNASLGLDLGSGFRLGAGTIWWDDYYASFTNTYKLADGREVEAKLPTFFELNANLSYNTRVGGQNVKFRLDLNNITNHENFTKASWTRDFNRNDALRAKYYMYVAQAPLFNAFLTTEITF